MGLWKAALQKWRMRSRKQEACSQHCVTSDTSTVIFIALFSYRYIHTIHRTNTKVWRQNSTEQLASSLFQIAATRFEI